MGKLTPFHVIWASQHKPEKVVEFKNEKTALAFKQGILNKGKIALLGSKEIKGKKIYEVEVYKKRLKKVV